MNMAGNRVFFFFYWIALSSWFLALNICRVKYVRNACRSPCQENCIMQANSSQNKSMINAMFVYDWTLRG